MVTPPPVKNSETAKNRQNASSVLEITKDKNVNSLMTNNQKTKTATAFAVWREV